MQRLLLTIKAPTPAHVVREGSADEWSHHGSYGVGCTENAGVCWHFGWWHGECEDGVDTASHSSTASSGDGTADDESLAVRCDSADQAAHLEDEDREHESPFHVEVFVSLAPGGLEGGDGEEERAAIPAHIVQRSELVCDLGNCGRNDRHVKGDEEHGHADAGQDGNELSRAGIHAAFDGFKWAAIFLLLWLLHAVSGGGI